MTSVLVVHGPNLHMLGDREKKHYGSMTLDEINRDLAAAGRAPGLSVAAFQSNHEDEIDEAIRNAFSGGYKAIIINPAAFTHTSIAVREALLAADLPFFEVHISNIQAREPFRRKSMVSDIASGVVMGFGPAGYKLALIGASHKLALQ